MNSCKWCEVSTRGFPNGSLFESRELYDIRGTERNEECERRGRSLEMDYSHYEIIVCWLFLMVGGRGFSETHPVNN